MSLQLLVNDPFQSSQMSIPSVVTMAQQSHCVFMYSVCRLHANTKYLICRVISQEMLVSHQLPVSRLKVSRSFHSRKDDMCQFW